MDSETDRAMDSTLCLDVHIHAINLPSYSGLADTVFLHLLIARSYFVAVYHYSQ